MTSNLNPIPPILRLNQDLLWSIFSINADIFSESEALRDTWVTSQVCKLWRDLMLATPSLWGRLIDLDAFAYSSDDWAHEVLRRSGNALLWVQGNNIEVENSLFFEILNKYWHRIQRLAIYPTPDALEKMAQNLLLLPAPHLQLFNLYIHSGRQGEIEAIFDNWPTGPLFADNAPALREFDFPDYKFSTQANWLRGISSLHIGKPFMIQELLQVLQRTPDLRYLRVHSATVVVKRAAQSPPLVYASLPNLDFCGIYCDIQSSIALLEHLDIPSTCRLIFDPKKSAKTNVSEDFLKSSLDLLSRLARRYLQIQQSKRLYLDLFYTSGLFSWTLKDDTLSYADVFCIRVHVEPKLTPLIFDDFTFPQLSKVPVLNLFLIPGIPTEVILPMLFSFSSVQSILLGRDTFRYLATLQNDIAQRFGGGTSPLLFPNLEIMKLHTDSKSPDDSLLGEGDMLHALLKFRKRHGNAVKVLDLRTSRVEVTPSLHYLEDMLGLHVIWTDSLSAKVLEYECGSGHPEMLPLSIGRPPAVLAR